MKTFRIAVAKPNGDVVTRTVAAEDRKAAEQLLVGLGFKIATAADMDKSDAKDEKANAATDAAANARLYTRPVEGARARTKEQIEQDKHIAELAEKLGIELDDAYAEKIGGAEANRIEDHLTAMATAKDAKADE